MLALPHNPYRKQLLVMATGTWVFFGLFLLYIRPQFVQNVGRENSYLPFFVIIFVGMLWSWWGITGRWKRSLLWSGIVALSVWLRVNSLLSIINVVLLLGFGGAWEYYWHLCRQPKSD